MLIQLPNGLLDGLDLFNYAEIDELRGKQQNYLADKELVLGNIGHVPKILADMVKSLQTKEGLAWKGNIEDAIQKLPSGDLETLLIKIRENTYGERFYHEAVCPYCQTKQKNLRLDLDKLVLDVMPAEEMIKPKLVVLPKSGKEVELKPLYLKDLFEVLKITTTKNDELITSLISVSLKRMGDKSPVSKADVDDLPATDIMFLQKKADEIKLEGSIDTDIEITCTNKDCKKDFKMKLNCYDSDFFDPTRGSPNTNM